MNERGEVSNTERSRPTSTEQPALLDTAGLDGLVTVLIERGYRVIGPTVRDNAIVLAELESAEDLPRGWGVDVGPGHYRLQRRDDDAVFAHSAGPQSWKQFLHPPRRRMFSTDRTGEISYGAADEVPRYAFIGVHGCDLAAIATLDRVLGGGKFPDGSFVRRRRQIFVVAANCTEPGGLCFCASMGTGPAAGPGYDLALTEQIDGEGRRYLVDVGTQEGADVLAAVPHREAGVDEISLRPSRCRSGVAPDGPPDAGDGSSGAADPLARVAAVGGGGQPMPDLRELHDGVPDVLLHQHRRHYRSDR